MISSEHWEINLETLFSCKQTHGDMASKWSSHLFGCHSSLQIPHSACQIHTLLRFIMWQQALSHNPNKQVAQIFLEEMAVVLGKTQVKADFTARWVGKYVPAILDYARRCQKKIITDLDNII